MFHKSTFGSRGTNLPSDINGMVPEQGDSPHDFSWDHDDFTNDFDDNGNGYEGYALEQWEQFVESATQRAAEANAALRAQNPPTSA